MNRIMDKTNPKARLKNFHKYGSKTGNLGNIIPSNDYWQQTLIDRTKDISDPLSKERTFY